MLLTGVEDRLAEARGGIRPMRGDHLHQALFAKLFVVLIARLGDAVAVEHDRRAGCEPQRMRSNAASGRIPSAGPVDARNTGSAPGATTIAGRCPALTSVVVCVVDRDRYASVANRAAFDV